MKNLALAAVTFCILLTGCKSAAEQAVRDAMIDGDSAKFRDVETCSADSSVTRGNVNGKNRMGAYVGFEPFFYVDGMVYFAGSDGDGFMRAMNRCYGTGTEGSLSDAAAAVGDAAAAAAADPAGESSNWTTDTDSDPLDDSKVITARLVATSGQSSMGGEAVTLIARCGSKKTEVYANWEDYLGDDSDSPYDEYKNVEVRVGDAKAQTERWGTSTDSKATFAPSAVSLLKQMVKADRLVLRTTPYNESPVTAVFDLKGARAAIEPIAKECGWTL